MKMQGFGFGGPVGDEEFAQIEAEAFAQIEAGVAFSRGELFEFSLKGVWGVRAATESVGRIYQAVQWGQSNGVALGDALDALLVTKMEWVWIEAGIDHFESDGIPDAVGQVADIAPRSSMLTVRSGAADAVRFLANLEGYPGAWPGLANKSGKRPILTWADALNDGYTGCTVEKLAWLKAVPSDPESDLLEPERLKAKADEEEAKARAIEAEKERKRAEYERNHEGEPGKRGPEWNAWKRKRKSDLVKLLKDIAKHGPIGTLRDRWDGWFVSLDDVPPGFERTYSGYDGYANIMDALRDMLAKLKSDDWIITEWKRRRTAEAAEREARLRLPLTEVERIEMLDQVGPKYAELVRRYWLGAEIATPALVPASTVGCECFDLSEQYPSLRKCFFHSFQKRKPGGNYKAELPEFGSLTGHSKRVSPYYAPIIRAGDHELAKILNEWAGQACRLNGLG